MCGIAGILKIHPPGPEGASHPIPHPLDAIPEAWLDVLDDSIKHRGPDGAGRFRDRAVRHDGTVVDIALVHRRLSIIDHAGGHQPMVHDGQRLRPDLTYGPGETPILAHEAAPGVPLVAVVFNGCIYNHRELRAELEASGYRFETDHSDTEVLLASWRSWNGHATDAGATRWLNGMYSILFWDRASGKCNARRDPFGEKPLQLLRTPDPTVQTWCSSRVGLESLVLPILKRTHRDLKPPPPPTLSTPIPQWIRQGWHNQRPCDGAWCSDVNPAADVPEDTEIPVHAGHFGVVAWMASQHLREPLGVEEADGLIRDAVCRRLDADVPLGCFLSGGIDSALIAHYAVEKLGRLDTFTVRMPSVAYDESKAAKETSVRLGTMHHTLDCNTDPSADLVKLIEHMGVPFGDSSLLPTFWVARAASEHVKVALSGDGGDELFCGYERHRVPSTMKRIPRIVRAFPSGAIPDREPKGNASKIRRLLSLMRVSQSSIGPELTAIFPRRDLKYLILSPSTDWDVCDAIDAISRRSASPRAWDVDEYLTGDLLRKTDYASMAVPIEVRCPFLDSRLAEATLGTPTDFLMPHGERKGLLKQVAKKYLPDHIINRPKQGFAIPIGEWFRTDYGGLRQLLHDHLRSTDPFPGLADAGVHINMGFVDQMLKEHDAAGEKSINPWRGRDHSQRLYMLLVLSIWAKWLDRVRRGDDKKPRD